MYFLLRNEKTRKPSIMVGIIVGIVIAIVAFMLLFVAMRSLMADKHARKRENMQMTRQQMGNRPQTT